MDTALHPDQALFVATTRKFLAAATPIGSGRARELEDEPFDRGWWRQGADLGWTSLLVPETLGGGSISGQGVLDLVLVAEEMGRVVAPGPLLPVNVVAAALADAGGYDGLLASILSGEAIVTWALQEPGGAWNGAGGALRGEPGGDGLVLTGSKTLVEAANQADQLLVVARTEEGIVEVLVPTTSPGLSVAVSPSLDLSRRYCAVDFAAVEVPAAAIVGRGGDAAAAVEWQLQLAVALQVAELVGVASAVFDFTLTYLDDRSSFGRPLASYQALKHRVADLKMGLEASAGVASEAARAVQERDPAASTVVSAAKAYVGERTTDIVQDCIQLHGGIGVTWEHDLHLYLRRALVNRFTYGTPEDHRLRIARTAGLG